MQIYELFFELAWPLWWIGALPDDRVTPVGAWVTLLMHNHYEPHFMKCTTIFSVTWTSEPMFPSSYSTTTDIRIGN